MGQARAAVAVWTGSRWCRASRLIGPPHGGEQRVIGCPGEFGEKFANQVRTGEIGWYEVPGIQMGQ